MRHTYKCIALVTLAMVLGACVSPPPLVRSESMQAFSLPVQMKFVPEDDEGDDHFVEVPTAAARFGIIPGSIEGRPSQPVHVVTDGRESFLLEFEALASVVGNAAKRLTRAAVLAGYRITPRETKLARISTFTYSTDTGRGLGSTYLADPTDGSALTLVYFDRTCHMRGPKINISVTGPGFAWIRFSQDGKSIPGQNPQQVLLLTKVHR